MVRLYKIIWEVFTPLIFLLTLLSYMAVLLSCDSNTELRAKELFDIPYGNMPGEFNTWGAQPGVLFQSFAYRNNIFYIANSNRVLMYSSTGVLLDYIAPAFGVPYGTFSKYAQNNIQYYAYPLGAITTIIANKKNVFIAHVLASEVNEIVISTSDINNKIAQQSQKALTQLLVYQDKKMKDVIGREGKKEFNFFSVQNIYTLKDDVIVVKSRETNSVHLYFFDDDGHLIKELEIKDTLLPTFSGSTKVSTDTLDAGLTINTKGLLANIVPSYKGDYAFVHVRYYDFYTDQYESTVKINFHTSKVFSIDLDIGVYIREVEIFDSIESTNLWNVNTKDKLIFLSPKINLEEEGIQSFTVLKTSALTGKTLQEKTLLIPYTEYLTYNLAYNKDDKIAGYFLQENMIKVVWWDFKNLKR